MTTINTSIQINASSEKVWAILMDFDAYASWNPFIQKIGFQNEHRNSLEVLIKPPKGAAMKFKPNILVKDENKQFTWLGKLGFKGLFDGRHSFCLEKIAANKTLFKHSEEFTGILVPLFRNSLEKNTRNGFDLMNKALKLRAENIKEDSLEQ